MGLAQFGSRGGRLRQRLGRPACVPHGRWIWARGTGSGGPARRRARLSGRPPMPMHNAEVMAAVNWVGQQVQEVGERRRWPEETRSRCGGPISGDGRMDPARVKQIGGGAPWDSWQRERTTKGEVRERAQGKGRRVRGHWYSSPTMAAADGVVQWAAASAPNPIGIEREVGGAGRRGCLQGSVGPDSVRSGPRTGFDGPERCREVDG